MVTTLKRWRFSYMVSVKLNEDFVVEALVDRVRFWTRSIEVIELYRKMYENYVYNGLFDGIELDVNVIVDNDYVNYCDIIDEDREYFQEILEAYKKNGLGDCSTEFGSGYGYSFIEAVDDEDEPKTFLVRY